MLRLKADSSKLSQNGSVPNDLFSDINTRSLNSVTVGENSGKISRGSGNAFVGFECGNQNIDGSFGVFIGYQAGQFNKNGNWNTFVGSYTGRQNSRGDKNTFVGFRAGELNLDGNECVAIGANAMRENSVGNRNVAVGISAGERILEGDNNTMIGAEAGQNIRSGNLNTMAGYRSGKGSFKGNENTYFGAYAGYSNELGDGNAFIGYKSGEYLTNGSHNVAVGSYTLQYATHGSCNIAIGAFAGSKMSGSGNVLVGTGAAANTVNGNYNTNVGTNSGNDANGNNNVYIGYEASKNTFGDKNVVIGSSAFSSNNSSNSVIIGYNTADSVFKNGSNNIFIGVGADSHTSKTSFAIAIGSKNTRSGEKAISIGENIANGGYNSLLLGYEMYSDSDQCVSIGYQTQINNVVVFNDQLNYIFPVNSNTEYKTFNLKENYTDTIILDSILNTVAVASVYNSNVYDSGCNLLEGIIRGEEINLLDIFNSNIIYQNITILNDTSNTTLPLISGISEIPPYNFLINSNTERYILNIPIHSDSSNLIPIDPDLTTSINYEYVIGRRLSIDSFALSNSYEIIDNKLKDTIFITNLELNPIVLESFETSNFFDKSSNRTIIITHPRYGDITFTNNELLYHPYPEALFDDADSFTLAISTKLGTETVISEYTPLTSINFTNKTYPVNTNLNFHKDKSTILDFTYSNIIDIEELDTNILFVPPSNLEIKDAEISITTPLRLVGGKTFSCTYLPTAHNALSYSNIEIITDTFSLEVIPLGVSIDYVVEYPKYGHLDLESYMYIPDAFNFTKDTFKAASNDTLYTIDILTKNGAFKTETLNTIKNPTVTTYNSNIYSHFETNIENRQINISVTNTTRRNGIVTTSNFSVRQTTEYEQRGYIHTCNIYITEVVIATDSNNFSNQYPITFNESAYYDYFAYRRDATILNNPLITVNEFTWDYSSSNGFSENGIPIQYGTGEQIYSNINNLQENRYFLIQSKSVNTDILYKEASNIIIYNSNVFYQNDIFVDNYNNYIYTSRSPYSNQPIATSNITQVSLISLPFKEQITNLSFSNDTYTTSNISTLQLQETNFYEYDGIYNVSSSNLNIILQKDKGPVTTFYQSNISNKEIHIWGESNLILTDRVVPINYYSNIEISTESLVPDISFRKGEYLFTDTLIHTNNISFLNNVACIGDGEVLISYINSSNKSVTQNIPSNYTILNPINLNIGLKKVATKLTRTEVFSKINSQYTISQPDPSIIFYKNNVATNEFTQSDINNELITIEGTGYTGTVILSLNGLPLIINKYIQNAYLNELSSNTTSNIITQSNNQYTHNFSGSIWDDLDSRRDDVTLYILNNPINGFLYSSNTQSIVNKIGYRDFKKEKIHYIPFSILQGSIDVFFSYSNVASPIYSINIRSEIVRDKPLENITRRIDIINRTINIDVDKSSYTYLTGLMEDFIGKDVIFYIVSPPEHGVILNANFLSVAYFTSQDILENNVFYQNYKGTTIDSFEIRVATNPYNLSLNKATVILRLLPFPKLLKNKYDYIYSDRIAYGKSNYYPLDSSKLDVSFGGIYIYEKENLEVFARSNGEYIKTDKFLKDEDVYYRPSQEFFQFNSNENKTMKMKFFTYSNVNINGPSPLAQFDVYKDLYVQEWFSKYNTFDSKNVIIRNINPEQIISYTKTSNDGMFRNKKCKIQFDYMPSQSILDLKDFGNEYNTFLNTYKYSFTLIDFNENVLMEIEFNETSNVAKIGDRRVVISNDTTAFDDWKRFYLINNDDANNEKLSIYINDVNYTDYNVREIESIDFTNLKDIIISVPITDPRNNYTGTIFKEINSDGSRLYYNLENYNTSIYFKSFQILLGIYDLTTQLLDENSIYFSTYNIAIGDYLRVNGFNNICIGKNFLTTGTGSIIIGNDIGSTPNTTSMLSLSFNEIFNSIIISTSSFINTKVRDVIAIGNNIFNNAGGSSDIDLFFSKKPVLIGNNITTATIDFHVNIQNSFLKTDVGYKQIYCGLEQEALCIGYSNNVHCNNSLSKLYVNGNVNVSGTIIEKSLESYRTRYVYASRRFTTVGVYNMVISWEKTSVGIHDILTLYFKFKCIGDATNYGYYNFESVIHTSTSSEMYSITQSMRGNITHTVLPLVNGLSITLNWDVSVFTVAYMEIESVCLNTLGNLVFA